MIKGVEAGAGTGGTVAAGESLELSQAQNIAAAIKRRIKSFFI